MTNTIETDSIKAGNGTGLAVAVGKAIVAALENAGEVDVERGDIIDDAEWSELVQYLARRAITLRGGVACAEVPKVVEEVEEELPK